MSNQGTHGGENQGQPDGDGHQGFGELSWTIPVIPGGTASFPIPSLGVQVQISPLDSAFARAGVIGGSVPNGTTMQITAVLPRAVAALPRAEVVPAPPPSAPARASLPPQQRLLAHVKHEDARPSLRNVPDGSVDVSVWHTEVEDPDLVLNADVGSVVETPGSALEASVPVMEAEVSFPVVETSGSGGKSSASLGESSAFGKPSASLGEIQGEPGSFPEGSGAIPEGSGAVSESSLSASMVSTLAADSLGLINQGSGPGDQGYTSVNKVLGRPGNTSTSVSEASLSANPPSTSIIQPSASRSLTGVSPSITTSSPSAASVPKASRPFSKGKAPENNSPSFAHENNAKRQTVATATNITTTPLTTVATPTAATLQGSSQPPFSTPRPQNVPEAPPALLSLLRVRESKLHSNIAQLKDEMSKKEQVVRNSKAPSVKKISELKAQISDLGEKLRMMESHANLFSKDEINEVHNKLCDSNGALKTWQAKRDRINMQYNSMYERIAELRRYIPSLEVELKTVVQEITKLTGEKGLGVISAPLSTAPKIASQEADPHRNTIVVKKEKLGHFEMRRLNSEKRAQERLRIEKEKKELEDLKEKCEEEKRKVQEEQLKRQLESDRRLSELSRQQDVQMKQDMQRNAKRKREEENWKQQEEERSMRDEERRKSRFATHDQEAARWQRMGGGVKKTVGANADHHRRGRDHSGNHERGSSSRDARQQFEHYGEEKHHRQAQNKDQQHENHQRHQSSEHGSHYGSQVSEHRGTTALQGLGYVNPTDRQNSERGSRNERQRSEHRTQDKSNRR
ncbi:hypothetical protein QBC41DRAFT_306749 [Cercophora samala]|uniref:Uncharacterized protein n=1 Tax=Cercophora samala TaxID=330535 RepID=A0AA39Z4A6_9PEZI|nr:hypothetical protein QBC41DRAFT_306749 [Cercophora samala]